MYVHHQTLYNFISDDFKVSHQKECLFKKTVGSKINFVKKNYGQQKFLKKKLWLKNFFGWINLVPKKFGNKILVEKIL